MGTMLILVDWDNIHRNFQLNPTDNSPLRVSFGAYKGDNLKAVICVACNQATIRTSRLNFALLEQVVLNIAHAVSIQSGDVVCEFAPCLTSPESADYTLLKLLAMAPFPSHQGPFASLVLVSSDRGFRSECINFLKENGISHAGQNPNELSAALSKLAWWARLRDGYERHYHTSSNSEPHAPVSGWSVPINTSSTATWAQEQPFAPQELLAKDRWYPLTAWLDRNPFWLSQCGVTTSSTRGVMRFQPRPPAVLGEVAEEDGLLLQHNVSAPPQARNIKLLSPLEPASVGPGAVYLPCQKATLRTRLPLDVLQAAVAHNDALPLRIVQTNQVNIDDTRALRTIPTGTPIGEVVKVEIKSSQTVDEFIFKINYDARLPNAWWNIQSPPSPTRVRSHQASTLNNSLRLSTTSIAARMRVIELGPHKSLCLSAPYESLEVSIKKLIRPQTIGVGVATIEGAKAKVIVLALKRSLPAKKVLTVVPIQDVARPQGLSESLWDCLKQLPFMVPRCQILKS